MTDTDSIIITEKCYNILSQRIEIKDLIGHIKLEHIITDYIGVGKKMY